jgi:hypothetical protein
VFSLINDVRNANYSNIHNITGFLAPSIFLPISFKKEGESVGHPSLWQSFLYLAAILRSLCRSGVEEIQGIYIKKVQQ